MNGGKYCSTCPNELTRWHTYYCKECAKIPVPGHGTVRAAATPAAVKPAPVVKPVINPLTGE